jgi:hypothetical protein
LTAQRISLRLGSIPIGTTAVAGSSGALLVSVERASPAPQLGLHGLASALVVFGHGQQLGLDL